MAGRIIIGRVEREGAFAARDTRGRIELQHSAILAGMSMTVGTVSPR